MRRFCLILLSALVATPVAVAAVRASTDGVLELRKVNAYSLVIVGSRGSLWGQMDSGRLVVTDPVLGDGQIYVTGADHTYSKSENVTVYSGKDIHFRVTGGRYRLGFKGAGIDLTAVGVGTATMTGDFNADDAGDYSIDGGGKWLSVGFVQKTVTFGVQPVAP